jgi:methyl-accepting chemotaxis protein
MVKPHAPSADDAKRAVDAALRPVLSQAAEDRRSVQHLATRVDEILSREQDINRRLDDTVAKLHRGISDVNSALKQATSIAENARSAAALEERMNTTDEANKALLRDLATSLGKARDQLRVLDESVNRLRGDVDRASAHLHDVAAETGSNSRLLSSNHPLVAAPRGAGVVTVE